MTIPPFVKEVIKSCLKLLKTEESVFFIILFLISPLIYKYTDFEFALATYSLAIGAYLTKKWLNIKSEKNKLENKISLAHLDFLKNEQRKIEKDR